ncbi:hypothetical protein AN944_01638 [Shewanella sp. P1-14-1]|uniref:hypothetical protein n=1 Tax=Shewanella sp. P1-14-1 TaxID=1723761 RepID=UPI0006D65CDC|nr:hypothetical protein [Shewanella sp. P1-14-1]KPZ71263.1 hypothetical protein AN944_01638 [Shewanella sp. P1-14-1]
MNKADGGLVPAINESLNSFIFRTLSRFGYWDFGTIIQQGGWGDEPKVPISAKGIFQIFEKAALLKLYEQTYLHDSKQSIFSNSLAYLEHFDSTFNPNKKSTTCGKLLPVRFCPFCIKEQLSNLGYSYFKVEWDRLSWCAVHLINLQQVPTKTSSKEVIKLISGVLKGEHLSGLALPVAQLKNSRAAVLSNVVTRIAPCGKQLIINYLVNNIKFFPEGYFDIFDYGCLESNQLQALNKHRLREEVTFNTDDFLEIALQNDYRNVMNFFIEELELFFFPIWRHKDSENSRCTLKSQKSNCSKCNYRDFTTWLDCPVAVRYQIYAPKKYILKVGSYSNIANNLIADYLVKVRGFQDSLGVREGEVKVRKDIESYKMYAGFGGKERYEQHVKKIMLSHKIY